MNYELVIGRLMFESFHRSYNVYTKSFLIGAKYEAAKNWKIRIVKDRWLFESMDKQRYIDPKPFLYNSGGHEDSVKTSTPERLSGSVACSSPMKTNEERVAVGIWGTGKVLERTQGIPGFYRDFEFLSELFSSAMEKKTKMLF